VRVFEGGRWTSQEFAGCERGELFHAEARHFLQCIEGRESPMVDVRAGVAPLEIALAALQSIDTGHVVEL
jgi:predicted dehydrogenase